MLTKSHLMRDRKSTDPRDKLYGLIGLAKSTGVYTVDLGRYVDYNKNNMTAFSDLARTALSRDAFDVHVPYPDYLNGPVDRPKTSVYENQEATRGQLATIVHARHDD